MFYKHQIRMTLDLKLRPRVVFPSDVVTVEDRLRYRREMEAGRPRATRGSQVLPTGSPFSKIIHPCQYKFIFRELYFATYPVNATDERAKMEEQRRETIHQLAHRKLNKKHYNDNRHQLLANQMGQRIVEGFYHQGRPLSWWPILYTGNDEIDRQIVTDLLYGAMGPARIDPKFRSTDVMCLLRNIRQDENFEQLSLVADALEDAGYQDVRVLDHLRSPAHKSLGDWIFKATGMIG